MKYRATLGWSFLQDVAPVTRPVELPTEGTS
jgi:hypothetical protein